MKSIFSHISLKEKILYVLYVIIILCLFLYSFTQIDLSLTFSRIEFLQNIVRSFQYVGYFTRPLSTYLFVTLVVSLFIFYIIFLRLALQKKLQKKFVWLTIITTTLLLTFSYNAFSYDIFNYIFDAKIITHYHQNPYEHKALDYIGDPMLSFMRWTHRTYPYGPLWLAITTPITFVGMNIFIPTFFMFKILMAASFIGCVHFIGKIFKKFAPEKEVFGLVFFGLQPLVLIESLVSGHIDIVMMFFALASIYFLVQKKYIWAWVLLAVSIGIKFVTVLLIPIFLLIMLMYTWKKAWWSSVWILATLVMICTVSIASSKSNFQPWYLLPLLSIAVFASYRYYVLIPTIIVSFFALGTYVPYLYVGNWDKPIPQMLSDMYLFSYSFSFFVVAGYFLYQQVVFAKHFKKGKPLKK